MTGAGMNINPVTRVFCVRDATIGKSYAWLRQVTPPRNHRKCVPDPIYIYIYIKVTLKYIYRVRSGKTWGFPLKPYKCLKVFSIGPPL